MGLRADTSAPTATAVSAVLSMEVVSHEPTWVDGFVRDFQLVYLVSLHGCALKLEGRWELPSFHCFDGTTSPSPPAFQHDGEKPTHYYYEHR